MISFHVLGFFPKFFGKFDFSFFSCNLPSTCFLTMEKTPNPSSPSEFMHTFSSINNIYSVKTVKLNKNNYAIWRQQVTAILKGKKLLGFVNGSFEMPSPIPNNDREFIRNKQGLNHEEWDQQDSLLMG